MKTPTDKPAAKQPQVNLKLEAWEKELFETVAKARGNNGVSALLRLLVVDEARRLGIPVNPAQPARLAGSLPAKSGAGECVFFKKAT